MNDPKYDVWFSLDAEKNVVSFLSVFSFHHEIRKKWKQLGYLFTNEKKNFDIVITGDTLHDAPVYGKAMLCFWIMAPELKIFCTVIWPNFPNIAIKFL